MFEFLNQLSPVPSTILYRQQQASWCKFCKQKQKSQPVHAILE